MGCIKAQQTVLGTRLPLLRSGLLVLLGLVQATWWFSERAEKKKNAKNAAGGLQQTISAGHAEEIALETKASRSSDFYFAFFLTCERCSLSTQHRRGRADTTAC